MNASTGSRSSESGTQSALTASNSASIAAYGKTSGDFTSYSVSDTDVLNNAQQRVAAGAVPEWRLGQLTVDLFTATTAGLYAAVAGVHPGDRIRVTSVPQTTSATTQVDVLAEGWAETYSDQGAEITFDTSPADAPPLGVWSDTSYGRWQCDSQTLNASITNSATTLAIATAAGKPTFTTSAGAYPMLIQIDAEVLKLGAAPSGSTSPQTFTSVTRGQQGTTAAAHSAGAAVNLYPAATWSL